MTEYTIKLNAEVLANGCVIWSYGNKTVHFSDEEADKLISLDERSYSEAHARAIKEKNGYDKWVATMVKSGSREGL